MGWDDSDDDDWESADLKLDVGPAAEAKQEWSDEETEEDVKAAKARHDAEKIKGTAKQAAKEKELTKLELAIIEREKREFREAEEAKKKKKAAMQAKMDAEQAGPSKQDQDRMLMENSIAGLAGELGLDDEWDGGGDEPDFDTTGLASQRTSGEQQPASAAMSDADFEQLAGLINAHIKQYEGRRGHLTLLKALCKQCTANMSAADSKQLADMMSTIFNAKVQSEREKDKGGKKGAKKSTMTQGKATGRDIGGRGGYDDDYDYDDY